VTDAVIEELSERLSRGDGVIDGGNSNWHDSRARAEKLAPRASSGATPEPAAASGG